MRLVEELESLIDALDAAGVNYAVCGGLALAVHGHARATEGTPGQPRASIF